MAGVSVGSGIGASSAGHAADRIRAGTIADTHANATSTDARAYAGDLSPDAAWRRLADDPSAQLIDCRTEPEWRYAGVPDLAGIGKSARLIEWIGYPDGEPNANFSAEVGGAGLEPNTPILVLCRSGVRSRAAAIHLTAAGYGEVYNIDDGFEGPLDDARHRGRRAGWKVADLPWAQE